MVTASGTPDAFVHVAPFQLFMQNIRGSGLGTYIAALDAIKDINVLSTAADPTNPRDDLIIAQQSDVFDGDANSDFIVKQVVGTPAPVPSDPTITGSSNHLTLARVRVNANATTITGSNITDLRTTGHAKSLVGGLHTVALGGLLPETSQAEQDALTGIYSGMQIWRADLGRVHIYNGTNWVAIPGTVLAEAWRTTNSTTTTTTEIGVLRMDGLVVPAGQQVDVCADNLMLTSTANEEGIVARFRMAVGSTATVSSTLKQELRQQTVTAQGQASGVLRFTYTPAATETLSIILTVLRVAGTGNVSINTIDGRIYFDAKAGGKSPANTGVSL